MQFGFSPYLFMILTILIINKSLLSKNGKQNDVLQILALCFYLAIGTKEEIVIVSILITLLLMLIKQAINKFKQGKEKSNINKQIPVGFYLCFANIATLILHNFVI